MTSDIIQFQQQSAEVLRIGSLLCERFEGDTAFREQVTAAAQNNDLEGIQRLFRLGGLSDGTKVFLEQSTTQGQSPTPSYKHCWGKDHWWGGCIEFKLKISLG